MPIWKDLDRHHKPKTIDELIDLWRPKEIDRYYENGKLVRVFEPPLILREK